MYRLLVTIALLFAVGRTPHAAAQEGDVGANPDVEATAHALEQRLRAPCCWNQTLDVHASPISQELRGEIRARLTRGETPTEIEAEMVARYGDRILAVPADNPLGTFALIALLLAVVAGGVVVFIGVRARKRGGEDGLPKGSGGQGSGSGKKEKDQDEWDARLDAELNDA